MNGSQQQEHQDKAAVTAYYDTDGFCHTIEVRLNAPGLSREDLAEAIRSVFLPGAPPAARSLQAVNGAGYRHHELGGTAVLNVPNTRHMNGSDASGVNGNQQKN